MKCPICTTPDLLMTERQGIEIDYCPQCRGVWLDRGELDKIIERSLRELAAPAAAPTAQVPRPLPPPYDGGHGYRDNRHEGDHHGYHGKKPFWKELFD